MQIAASKINPEFAEISQWWHLSSFNTVMKLISKVLICSGTFRFCFFSPSCLVLCLVPCTNHSCPEAKTQFTELFKCSVNRFIVHFDHILWNCKEKNLLNLSAQDFRIYSSIKYGQNELYHLTELLNNSVWVFASGKLWNRFGVNLRDVHKK